jgi:hexosaminidase
VPGHARAAIKAMEARYYRLKGQGKLKEAEEFLLTDFDDKSVYESVQLWHDNVICIAKESCYRFIDTVVSELVSLYREAGAPLLVMHTGGDEIPDGAWEGSPICQAFMKERGMNSIQELLNYFLGRFRDILKKHDLVVAGWEEIALAKEKVGDKTVIKPNPEFVNANFRPYVWNNVWGWGQEDFAYRLANAGYQVVLCNVTNLYFDLAYEKDPSEPGYYWGGFLTTRKPFDFVPLDIYANATVNGWGQPLDAESVAGMARLTPEGRKNIIGIQGQIWGENARSKERVEHYFAPRALSFAERAWAKDPEWTEIADPEKRKARMDADWNVFANRLAQRDLVRLDGLDGGYGYRVPVPGARIENGRLHANISLPGFSVRYTLDGSEPTIESPPYREPVEAKGTVKLAAFTSTGRRGRVISVKV